MSNPTTPPKYTFENGQDVYDFLRVIPNKDPAAQHAIKKLTNAGNRGAKDAQEDYQECIWSLVDSIYNLKGYNKEMLIAFLNRMIVAIEEK